jgi:hypothetical protein
VQLDLSSYQVQVVNTSNTSLQGLKLTANLYDLQGKQLAAHTATVDLPADKESDVLDLQPGQWLQGNVVFAELQLTKASGEAMSRNFYWLTSQESSLRKLDTLPEAAISVNAEPAKTSGEEDQVTVTLANHGTGVALAAKLTLQDTAKHDRILPAYYSDNYISLLPGESRQVTIRYPKHEAKGGVEIALRGWNVSASVTSITSK